MWEINQRVLSRTEPELGIGIIESIKDNKLQVSYAESQESRTYNLRSRLPLQIVGPETQQDPIDRLINVLTLHS
jgi:hypothetical protein